MPVKKQDAHRALELLEAYHDKLTDHQDLPLKNAIENVIRIFKSCLFQALLDIQEFYEVTLMNNEKSVHQKMMETLSVATNLELNSEALAFPIAYEITSASRLANYQSSRSISGLLLPFQSSSSTTSSGGGGCSNLDPTPPPSILPPSSNNSLPPTSAPQLPPTSPDFSDVSSQQHSVMDQQEQQLHHGGRVRQFGLGRSTPMITQILDSNYVYETITLDRGTKGFGFSISGGSNNPHIPGDPSIYVTDILGNHSAALDGRFRINDIIVSVNKANMCNIPHMTAVEILKNAGDTVTFVIKRRRNPNEVSVKLEIIKTNRGLGFSIGGGVGNQHIPGDNGIFVTDIVRDGASYGKLQISDRLIYVNGVNLENVTHDKAVMVLKSTQDRVVMIVGRRVGEGLTNVNHHQLEAGRSQFNNNTSMGQRANSMDLITQSDSMAINNINNSITTATTLNANINNINNNMNINTNNNISLNVNNNSGNIKCQSFLAPPTFSDSSKEFDFDTSPIYEDALFAAPPSVGINPSIPRGPRRVILRKGVGELGFNIVGGEDGEGIFVSYILPGGEADLSGEVYRGDQILSVNNVDMFRARHEKAANVLKAADDVVDLVLAYNPEEYNRFEAKVYELRQQLIRSTSRLTLRTTKKKTLFVRALFDYDPSKDKDLPARGLAFCYGDILHVTNASDDEWWQARRIVPGSDDGLGIIPSKNRIERKEKTRLKNVKFLSREADGKGSLERKKKSLFGRRLSLTRSREKSKSLDGLSQEPVPNLEEPILTYEVVVQQELQYVRPLVLVGLLKEAISGDLILEYPDLFANCLPHTTRPKRDYEVDGQDYHFVASRQQMEEDIERGLFIEAGQYNGNLYGTSLASILRVASEDKHCILDVSPNAIKRLQMNGLYPITILVKPATISTIQAWNRRLNEGEARKVYENNLKLEQSYADYLTAIVIGDQAEEVYASVKDVIWNQSSSYIWVPADPFS